MYIYLLSASHIQRLDIQQRHASGSLEVQSSSCRLVSRKWYHTLDATCLKKNNIIESTVSMPCGCIVLLLGASENGPWFLLCEGSDSGGMKCLGI